MARLVTLVLAASFCIGSLVALGLGASATPLSQVPGAGAVAAIESLAADGLIDGYPDESFRSDRPLTRSAMAVLVARAIAKLQANGAVGTSRADLDKLQRLMDGLKDELVVLGVRVTTVDEIFHPKRPTSFVPSFQVHGAIFADDSYHQSNGGKTLAGGPADPFVNAFLTSPANNSPFEHDPGPGNLVRFDNKVTPTWTVSDNLTVSLPIHIINYDAAFTSQDRYLIQPAVVLNFAKLGAVKNASLRAGLLDNLESSRLGLTYRAPDATQQSTGFQNPVQPYEYGVQFGGLLNKLTRFQFSLSRVDQAAIDTFPDQFAPNNYFLTVTPPQNSLVQPGAPNSSAGIGRTDTFVSSAGPITYVYLSMKAALGTVYVSAVNGVVCTSAGLTATGTACPIGPRSWYYIDATNQVVFQSALPVGSTVQISYALSNSNSSGSQRLDYFQRYHLNARVNQQIKGVPGAEIGLSYSRLFDAGTFSSTLSNGTGYGTLSDTVFGLDTRLPLTFIRLGSDRTQHPVLFGEGAYSKYTPDFHNTPAMTDSAAVVGLRLPLFGATATVKYQRVGPNFMDGAPLRYLGPGPSTFQFWRGNFFPQFFGFANNLAINRIFDGAVTPGCAGAACTRNALTYIYPVFNPFVASGPQFYSAFAPNSQGFTANITFPFSAGDVKVNGRLLGQHLFEVTPNGFGQIAYGPGFSSGLRLKLDKFEGGLQFGLPVLGRTAALNLTGTLEHLYRTDMTAYAYVPFNPMSGGPDASSGAALNAYLAGGATPVLFFPNYVDERHTLYALGLTMPVARYFHLDLGYNTQTYHGSYGTTLGQNIAQRKDVYGGTLTYTIPKTMSSIGVLFGNQKYIDYVLPTFNFSQNREDLNYSIRF